jgi:hypothetical protein
MGILCGVEAVTYEDKGSMGYKMLQAVLGVDAANIVALTKEIDTHACTYREEW